MEYLNIKVGTFESEASRSEIRAMGETLNQAWRLSGILPGTEGYENMVNIKNLSELLLRAANDSPANSTD